MHAGALAARSQAAQISIGKSAAIIAREFCLDDQALRPRRVFDPAVQSLLEMEAVAQFLSDLANAIAGSGGEKGPTKEPVEDNVEVEVEGDDPFLALEPEIRWVLVDAGLDSAEAIARCTDSDLLALNGIAKRRLEIIRAHIPHVPVGG